MGGEPDIGGFEDRDALEDEGWRRVVEEGRLDEEAGRVTCLQ